MKKNSIKSIPALLACLSTAAAFAGMDMDSRVSQLEAQMKQVRTATENKNFGAKNAYAGPMIDDAYGFYMGIGATYQAIVLGSTEYAYSEDDISQTLPIVGDLREVKDTWSWGIDALVGYNTDHDGYDIRLSNRYFDTSTSNSVSAGFGGSVLQLRASTTITGVGTEADGDDTLVKLFAECGASKSYLDITYDLLSLDLGRSYFVSQYLSFKPTIGIMSSWLWLHNHISYSGDPEGDADFLDDDSVYVDDKSNWWGIGPKFGLTTEFGLGGGFALFGEGVVSLMYGRDRVSHHEFYTDDVDDTIDIKSYSHNLISYVDTIIGGSYEFMTDDNKNHFKIRIGYENQLFMNANQMIRVYNELQIIAQDTADDDITGIVSLGDYTKQSANMVTSGLKFDFTWSF